MERKRASGREVERKEVGEEGSREQERERGRKAEGSCRQREILTRIWRHKWA